MGSRVLGLVREMVLNAVFAAGKSLTPLLPHSAFPISSGISLPKGLCPFLLLQPFQRRCRLTERLPPSGLPALSSPPVCGACAITLIGIFGSEWIVKLVASVSIPYWKAELTTQLTRILSPSSFSSPLPQFTWGFEQSGKLRAACISLTASMQLHYKRACYRMVN